MSLFFTIDTKPAPLTPSREGTVTVHMFSLPPDEHLCSDVWLMMLKGSGKHCLFTDKPTASCNGGWIPDTNSLTTINTAQQPKLLREMLAFRAENDNEDPNVGDLVPFHFTPSQDAQACVDFTFNGTITDSGLPSLIIVEAKMVKGASYDTTLTCPRNPASHDQPQPYVQNFHAVSMDAAAKSAKMKSAPSAPKSGFRRDECIRLAWESNCTSFKLYSSDKPDIALPVVGCTCEVGKLNRSTVFFLEATIADGTHTDRLYAYLPVDIIDPLYDFVTATSLWGGRLFTPERFEKPSLEVQIYRGTRLGFADVKGNELSYLKKTVKTGENIDDLLQDIFILEECDDFSYKIINKENKYVLKQCEFPNLSEVPFSAAQFYDDPDDHDLGKYWCFTDLYRPGPYDVNFYVRTKNYKGEWVKVNKRGMLCNIRNKKTGMYLTDVMEINGQEGVRLFPQHLEPINGMPAIVIL